MDTETSLMCDRRRQETFPCFKIWSLQEWLVLTSPISFMSPPPKQNIIVCYPKQLNKDENTTNIV